VGVINVERGEEEMKAHLAVLMLLGVMTTVVLAERPQESRDKATLVVVGQVKKITTKESKWLGDGIRTDYTADVVVDKVEKGKGAKKGDTIKVNWYRVTKSPSKPPPGAYGHSYPIKERDEARFWLLGGKSGWTIIYNSKGVEKLTK
jgi:hypothetical protein